MKKSNKGINDHIRKKAGRNTQKEAPKSENKSINDYIRNQGKKGTITGK